MTRLVIGSPNAEHLALVLPETGKSEEGWYQAQAQIRVEGFSGDILFFLQLSDVASFAEQLSTLQDALSGKAILEPVEGQLRVECVGNGRGQIAVSGFAFARATFGSRLEFAFDTDQTFLSEPLRSAHEFVAAHQ